MLETNANAPDEPYAPVPVPDEGGCVLETNANAPDEPCAPVPDELHARDLTKQPGPPRVLGGLRSREKDFFLLQLDDAPDEPMAFVPKQPGLPSVLGGRRGREVDIFSVQLLLTRVKMSEELAEQLMLDLFEKHEVGVPLEHSMGLGGAGLGGAGWAAGELA